MAALSVMLQNTNKVIQPNLTSLNLNHLNQSSPQKVCGLYLHRAVKEAIELHKASSRIWAGWCRFCVLVDMSWLTEEWVSVAEDNQTSKQGTHEKSSKHAGDEDVHVDHLVGLTCLDIPHTYNTLRHWLTPWWKQSKRSLKRPSQFNDRNVHVCAWTQPCSFCFYTSRHTTTKFHKYWHSYSSQMKKKHGENWQKLLGTHIHFTIY